MSKIWVLAQINIIWLRTNMIDFRPSVHQSHINNSRVNMAWLKAEIYLIHFQKLSLSFQKSYGQSSKAIDSPSFHMQCSLFSTFILQLSRHGFKTESSSKWRFIFLYTCITTGYLPCFQSSKRTLLINR